MHFEIEVVFLLLNLYVMYSTYVSIEKLFFVDSYHLKDLYSAPPR